VTAALVTGMLGLYGILIPLVFSARKHAKSANDQVTNSHTVNLRDDLDGKHSANSSRFGRLESRVGGIERGMGRIEDHLGIERTKPVRRTRPTK
jgi:hypothetical protein